MIKEAVLFRTADRVSNYIQKYVQRAGTEKREAKDRRKILGIGIGKNTCTKKTESGTKESKIKS